MCEPLIAGLVDNDRHHHNVYFSSFSHNFLLFFLSMSAQNNFPAQNIVACYCLMNTTLLHQFLFYEGFLIKKDDGKKILVNAI
jgi:hypothetical protein